MAFVVPRNSDILIAWQRCGGRWEGDTAAAAAAAIVTGTRLAAAQLDWRRGSRWRLRRGRWAADEAAEAKVRRCCMIGAVVFLLWERGEVCFLNIAKII